MPEPHGLPGWLSQDELDAYIAEFTRTGFTGGINWYRNLDRNWELTAHLAERKIEVPSLFVGGAADPVLLMTPPSTMDGWVDRPPGRRAGPRGRPLGAAGGARRGQRRTRRVHRLDPRHREMT